jgi:hypothetical protein
MKSYVAEVLIVVGGLLILVPFYTRERANDRVADFYSRQGSAITLPEAMQPKIGVADCVSVAIGIGAIIAGVGTDRFPKSSRC